MMTRAAAVTRRVKSSEPPANWKCRCGAFNADVLQQCAVCGNPQVGELTFKDWKSALATRANLDGFDHEKLLEYFHAGQDTSLDAAIESLGLQAFEGIPETQAAAAAKESLASELMPGVVVNEHGVVVRGGECLKLRMPRGVAAEIRICEVREGEWRTAFTFEAGTHHASGPISMDSGPTFIQRSDAIAHEMAHFRRWLQPDLDRSDTPEAVKAAIRAAMKRLQPEEQRLIGSAPSQVAIDETADDESPLASQKSPRIPPAKSKAEKRELKKSAAGTKNSSAERDLAGIINATPITQAARASLVPGDNNRVDFDEAGLQELADSIRQHGVLQPILAQEIEDERGFRIQIIAGERRWRAAGIAGVGTIPVRLVKVTAAEARELRLIENLKRKDLSAIEEAIGYQQLLEGGNLTQAQVGERVGVTQSTIANRLRLLKLPEAWQKRIIGREISEAHARDLVAWADQPKVLDLIDREISREAASGGKKAPWSEGVAPLRQWPDQIRRAIRHGSFECDQGDWYNLGSKYQYKSGRVLFTQKDLDRWGTELELITLPSTRGYRAERRALNLKRWLELHGNLEKAAQAKEAQKSRKEAGAKAEALTPAEKRQRTLEIAEQFNKRIYRYRTAWYLARVHEAIAAGKLSDTLLLKLLLHYTAAHGERGSLIGEVVSRCGGTKKSCQRYWCQTVEVLKSLATVSADRIPELARQFISECLLKPFDGNNPMMRPSHIEVLAGEPELGINLAKQWRVDEAFLLLHSKEQLLSYAKGQHLAKTPLPEKRGELVKVLLAANCPSTPPSCLLKAKEVPL